MKRRLLFTLLFLTSNHIVQAQSVDVEKICAEAVARQSTVSLSEVTSITSAGVSSVAAISYAERYFWNKKHNKQADLDIVKKEFNELKVFDESFANAHLISNLYDGKLNGIIAGLKSGSSTNTKNFSGLTEVAQKNLIMILHDNISVANGADINPNPSLKSVFETYEKDNIDLAIKNVKVKKKIYAPVDVLNELKTMNSSVKSHFKNVANSYAEVSAQVVKSYSSLSTAVEVNDIRKLRASIQNRHTLDKEKEYKFAEAYRFAEERFTAKLYGVAGRASLEVEIKEKVIKHVFQLFTDPNFKKNMNVNQFLSLMKSSFVKKVINHEIEFQKTMLGVSPLKGLVRREYKSGILILVAAMASFIAGDVLFSKADDNIPSSFSVKTKQDNSTNPFKYILSNMSNCLTYFKNKNNYSTLLSLQSYLGIDKTKTETGNVKTLPTKHTKTSVKGSPSKIKAK